MNLLTNFVNIVQNLLPYFLRKLNFIQFLNALVKPLSLLHNNPSVPVTNFGQKDISFYQWYEYIRNYLKFNGQIIYLEKFLNQTYLPLIEEPWASNDGIYILNTASSNFSYIYNTIELKPPIYFYNISEVQTTYLFNKSEASSMFDFIVFVPDTLTYETILMQSRINQYKLGGKSYDIQVYTT